MNDEIRRWNCKIFFLPLFVFLVLSPVAGLAASPKGVMKQAMHWTISADWLDPATATFAIPAYHPLYMFHDA
jgi:hypothetical protein